MLATIRKVEGDTYIPASCRAATLFPVLAYDEDQKLFICDDQTVGFGFICQPLNGADEKIQDRVNGFMTQDYPKNTIAQFFSFRSPDISQEIYKILGLRDGFRHEILSATIQERAEFLKKHTRERITATNDRGIYDNGIVHDQKLIISFKIPISGRFPTEKEYLELKQIRTKCEASIQSIGVAPHAMTSAQYKRVMGTILNWGTDASWKHENDNLDQDKAICDQLLDFDTQIDVYKNKLVIGDYHVKILSAKKTPDKMFFGDALAYIGDLAGTDSGVKENYFICMNVFYPDHESEKTKLERKRQFTVNQAYGPLLKFVPVLADKKHSFDVLYESLKEGSRPIKTTYTLAIFAPTAERAEEAATKARNIWRESRFEMMEDKFVCLPIFINHLPLCTDRKAILDLYRYKTMSTEQVVPMLPIFGEWKGTGTFHATLISRNGQIMSQSLHDSDTNKNLVIAAESGSGKSFEVNELITSYLSEGAQVWVIDAGRSYEKLCATLKGEFVHFGENSKVCLAPFANIEEFDEDEDAINANIAAMASAKGTLDEWQIASLKRVINEIWQEKGKKTQIDDIAERCLKSGDTRLSDIGTQLYAFTSKGSYGKYFKGDFATQFQSQLTVVELDDLQGRKHLRQVVLLQLIQQIQNEVFLGEKNRKKVVIIDEAWDLLKEGEVAVFMEHAYRKFRKYGGSVIIATQSINDLYENAVGRAIAENSSSMYLLGQTAESVESVRATKRLSLSDGGYNTLLTVHTVQGVYSEIFLKTKAGIGVGRLIVPDFQKLLYSTNPVDTNQIKRSFDQGFSYAEAIRHVIRERQQGVRQ